MYFELYLAYNFVTFCIKAQRLIWNIRKTLQFTSTTWERIRKPRTLHSGFTKIRSQSERSLYNDCSIIKEMLGSSVIRVFGTPPRWTS